MQIQAMDRALALAVCGIGSTAPNPPVGCVILKDGVVVGEGYHRAAGLPHAEAEALQQAGEIARGATVFVTLEPCNHHGRTPPCASALVNAGVAQVIIGTTDPNPATNGAGIATLRRAGITVDVLEDIRAKRLIEIFTHTLQSKRSYLALKLAMSLDGAITSRPGVQEWLTGEPERLRVRDFRIEHDGVLVGAGTVRVDDPQLTVRPRHERARPYQRVIMCETDTIATTARVFEQLEGYAKTIVVAPAGIADRFENLADVADILLIGDAESTTLDLGLALQALRERREIYSLLCEGGPTLGARLIAQNLVDRFYWAIAPRLLANPQAVPVLAGTDLALLNVRAQFDSCERVGEDIIVSGTFHRV
ncbi:MAG: bifunctional diaminohydroxyphosphoribosylaminopyrimidine deaminase/5-amino-6-(5-phosphoribosylamino)uracil reductase RibD [Vulcanimicrobiaceae bacterium]